MFKTASEVYETYELAGFEKEAISATAVGGAIESRLARQAGTAFGEAPSVMGAVAKKLKGAAETEAQVRRIGASAADRSRRIGGSVGEHYQTISNVADAHLNKTRSLGTGSSSAGAKRFSNELNPVHEVGHLQATAHPVQKPGLLANMGLKKPGMFTQYQPDAGQVRGVSKLKRL